MKQMTEHLLHIMEKFEAKMMAKLDAYQENMDAWLEEMTDGQRDGGLPRCEGLCTKNGGKSRRN
jgi:hypothetical protein